MLLAGVVSGGGARGLGRDDLVRHVTAPGAGPDRLQAGMDAFPRFGTNFHGREGHFFFDSEQNEHAKVELEAVKLNEEAARAELVRIWQQDVFPDTRQSVVFQDADTTRQALEALDRKPPRYALAPRRLSAPEFAAAVLAEPWPASTPRPEPYPPESPPEPTPPRSGERFEPVRDPGEAPPTSEPPGVVTEECATIQCRGRGELRQQTATRLIDVDDSVIRSARFTTYTSYTDQGLASQLAAWRGTLSGHGESRCTARYHDAGANGKATLEQHCEQLPEIPDGAYAARVRIDAPAVSEAPEAEAR